MEIKNMLDRNKQVAKTIIIFGAGTVFAYAINFVLTSYITNKIGIEAYGYVSIAKTFVSYADIVMTSLTAFIVRYISVSFHSNNLKEANSYYSSSIFACATVSIFIFLIVLIGINHIEDLLVISDYLLNPVKILFIIVFINFIVSTVNVPLGVYAYAKDRLDITGIIKILSYILESIVLYSIFKLFIPQIWFVAIGSLAASILTLCCNYFYKNKIFSELMFKRKDISLVKIRNLVKTGIWDSLNTLGNTLNSGLDLILSNIMLSAVATGQIAVSKALGSMIQSALVIVSQPFKPQMLNLYSKGNKEDFLAYLKKAMATCGWFSNIVVAGFIVLGNLYFDLWLPGEDTQLLYCLTVITIANFITDGVLQPLYYINTLTLKNKIPCWITILGGIFNVVSMYVLIKYTSLGVYAIVITTAVIMITINLLFNPIYASRCMKVEVKIIYKFLLCDFLSFGFILVCFITIERFLNPESWIGLIISAFIMTLISIPIHLLCMTERIHKKNNTKASDDI